MADQEDRDWQRLDKWLWCARFMRALHLLRRAGGPRECADQPPAHRQGARKAATGGRADRAGAWPVRVVRVLALAARRGPAAEAAGLCQELEGKVGVIGLLRLKGRFKDWFNTSGAWVSCL